MRSQAGRANIGCDYLRELLRISRIGRLAAPVDSRGGDAEISQVGFEVKEDMAHFSVGLCALCRLSQFSPDPCVQLFSFIYAVKSAFVLWR